tara:strand:+ start:84 stop:557 length:474 start_codon:yes stop_codon:yes gene_type:complete
MNKNIENITEELIMRYVEGDLDLEESQKFERILSQSEYLNNRVSILKSISDKQPSENPSRKVHNQILSDLNISDNSKISFIKKYTDYFMGMFEERPVLMGSIVSGLSAAVVIFFIFSGDSNSININENSKGTVIEDQIIEKELEEEDSKEDTDSEES